MSLGAIGMTMFAVDLYFAARRPPTSATLTVEQFVAVGAPWRVMIDLGLMSLFACLLSVPMYALMQLRTRGHAPRAHHRRKTSGTSCS